MPLRDDQRLQQAAIGEVFVTAAFLVPGDRHERLRTTARVQGASALALGVEIGFFDEPAAARLLGRLELNADADITTLRIGSSPLLADRVRHLGAQGFATPGYRPRLSENDASRIALRSVLLPITRAWQTPLHLPAFFERVSSGTDASEEPATVGEALRYLATATQAIRSVTVGDWLPEDHRFGNEAWLGAELASLYQLQIDTSRPAVKARLRELAEGLVSATVDETRQIIFAEPADTQTQAEWLARLEERAEEWRVEALDVVEQFDAALPVMATAAGA